METSINGSLNLAGACRSRSSSSWLASSRSGVFFRVPVTHWLWFRLAALFLLSDPEVKKAESFLHLISALSALLGVGCKLSELGALQ